MVLRKTVKLYYPNSLVLLLFLALINKDFYVNIVILLLQVLLIWLFSNNTETNIKLDLMKKGCEKDIAYRVSSSSINRVLDSISKDKIIKNYDKLPQALGINKFKATKDTISKMAFIIVNQDKRNIFDIRNSRLNKDIESYFKNYSKKERNKVKFITMDLYKHNYKLMHSLFRNAILIADRFHIIVQPKTALDNTRIKLCNKNNPNCRKLKKY